MSLSKEIEFFLHVFEAEFEKRQISIINIEKIIQNDLKITSLRKLV